MSWIADPLTRFIAQIVVVLVTARVLGRVARRLGQPALVAEIVAGIVLGPSVLGWLAPSMTAALFPTGSLEPMRLISQLGLMLFVFVIALELDPAQLRGRLRTSLAVSVASISVPFALGSLLAAPLAAFAGPDGDSLSFALFLGAAMSITALPVLARILADHHLLRTPLGALALTCAAIDDLIAWCVLAFVAASVRTDGLGDALVTTLMAIGFVVVMLFVVRPLLSRLAERRRAPLAVTPDVLAAVIIGLLVSAWITEWIGIHLVFGAFAFGAVLPRRDGFARAFVEKLEDLVGVLFLPLFFAISGLRTDIELVVSPEHLVACAAIVVVASLGKFAGSALVARATGLPWRDAGALGVLMNTRGLMELIAINIGFELGVISSTVFSMMVVMVLLTTVVATPLLRRIYPAREAVRDLLAVEPPPPARAGSRILTCIAHDRAGPALVAMAHQLAGSTGETIALHLARTDGRTPRAEPPDPAGVLDPALDRAAELGLVARPLAFESNDVAADIIRVADLRDADIVLLGGVVPEVLRHAPGTVAIHLARETPSVPSRVLVVLHEPRYDHAVLELAGMIQRTSGAEVALLGTRTCLDAASVHGGLVATPRVGAAEAALDHAGGFDLVMVGVAATPRPRLPERLVQACPTSLLVVRGPLERIATARIAEG